MSSVEGEVLGGGQRHARGGDALDDRVVGEVDEQDGALDGARAAEVLDEEVRLLEGDAHGGEDDGELPRLRRGCVACRAICAASCACGRPEPEKIGSFWPRTSVMQAVDGRDAGLDELGRVVAANGLIGAPLMSATPSGMTAPDRRRWGRRRRRRRGRACRATPGWSCPGRGSARSHRLVLMPCEASNTCTTARLAAHLEHLAAAHGTRRPARSRPARRTSTPSTPSTSISGPSRPRTCPVLPDHADTLRAAKLGEARRGSCRCTRLDRLHVLLGPVLHARDVLLDRAARASPPAASPPSIASRARSCRSRIAAEHVELLLQRRSRCPPRGTRSGAGSPRGSTARSPACSLSSGERASTPTRRTISSSSASSCRRRRRLARVGAATAGETSSSQ